MSSVLDDTFVLWQSTKRAKHAGEVFISFNKNAVLLSKALIERMGNPSYVQPLWSRKHRQVAIRACTANDCGAYEVKKSRKICSTHMCEDFAEVAGVEFSGLKCYRVSGEYYADENVAVFGLG